MGKLSGPIWTQNVRIEMTARGANLKVMAMLRYSMRPNMICSITVIREDIR